jgi:pyruvoyl-dependent arginine decarboxylase (PvlArgDC)
MHISPSGIRCRVHFRVDTCEEKINSMQILLCVSSRIANSSRERNYFASVKIQYENKPLSHIIMVLYYCSADRNNYCCT